MGGSQMGGNHGWASEANDPRSSTSPLQVALAYLVIAAVNLMYHFLRKAYPNSYPGVISGTKDELDEEALNSKLVVIGSQDNWWAKASVGGDSSATVKSVTMTETATA